MFSGDNGWTPINLTIIEALRIYEDSICGNCGQSTLLSHEDDSISEYLVQTSTCHSCEALETGRPKNPPPGQKRYLIPTHGLSDEVVEMIENGPPDDDDVEG